MPESVDTHQHSVKSDDLATHSMPVNITALQEFNHQTPDTRHIEPIRQGDLRALVDLLKKNDLLPTKTVTSVDITRRDIIEYAYTRLMAYALDQAATQLLTFDFSEGNLEKLREDISDVVLDVDTAPDGLRFTPTQRAAFERALHLLIDDLMDFKAHLPVENLDQYVREHLGTRFEYLPSSSYTFDTKTYPGVIIVRIPLREDYIKVAPEDSQGVYNQALGEGLLRGRVLVVRSKQPPDKSTEYHEYLHFLNSKLKHLEPLPRKEKQAEAKVEAETLSFERKLNELETEKEKVEERKYSEMRLRGRASEAIRQQLTGIRERIEKYVQARETVAYFSQAEITTYSDPDVKKAFDKVRDELQAYLIGGNEVPRKFIASTLGTGLAETLSQTTQGNLFLLELGALKEIMLLAANTDLNPQEVGFLVSGARNLSQAAKFVYLHLMQTPKRYQLPDLQNEQFKAA